MKDFQKVRLIANKVRGGAKFCSFQYEKENGAVSNRTVVFGVNVEKKMEREGRPVTGKGNWHKGNTEGKLGFYIRRNNTLYVRGTDIKDGKLKIFKLSGVTQLK